MTTDLLSRVWAELHGQASAVGRVHVHDSTGLVSQLSVGDLAVGAASAMLLAAAELAALPASRNPDPVHVDAAHVGIAVRSERYLRVDGVAAPLGFAPLSRFWPAADGWVRLHANYPHHADAAYRALGQDVPSAVAGMSAVDVEDAVVAAGGVAAAVRGPEQWAISTMGAAVADHPLVELHRVDTAPARDVELHRLRVLDLTRVLAGPVATRALAARGADVLRLDPPQLPEDRSTLLETGSGKRHAEVDIGSRDGRAVLEQLLVGADVLVHGYRPGALARFGLDGDALAERHPHLVVASISAWGWSGPWSQRRGFDSLVQAATGIAARCAGDDGAPGSLPAQALDHSAGHLLAAAVLRALALRRDGGTWHARTSLASLALWLLAAPTPTSPHAGAVAGPDAEQFLVDLASDHGRLTVVRPVGVSTWTSGVTTSAPAWRT